jgi:hypothetical protein
VEGILQLRFVVASVDHGFVITAFNLGLEIKHYKPQHQVCFSVVVGCNVGYYTPYGRVILF